MTMGSWNVRAVGRDCLGNISGYTVERSGWVPSETSQRDDGLIYRTETANTFYGDIYEAGTFTEARAKADGLANDLNTAGQET